MTTSQNGWPLVTPATYKAKTTGLDLISGRVRKGDVYTVLAYVAAQVHRRVERVQRKQSWGWAYRAIRGATKWSNHASATAVDLNSAKHPLGRHGTFTARQVKTIHKILAEVDGVVRWGGDYWPSRPDEMHFEINLQPKGSPAKVRAVAARLRGEKTPEKTVQAWTYPVLRKGARGALVVLLKRRLLARHPIHARKTLKRLRVPVKAFTGQKFDAVTEAVLIDVQKLAKLRVDGAAGREVWTHLGLAKQVRTPKKK